MNVEHDLVLTDRQSVGGPLVSGAPEVVLVDPVPELAREDPALYLASVFEQAAALASLADPRETAGVPYNDFSDSIIDYPDQSGFLRQVLSVEGAEIAEQAAFILCGQLGSREEVLRVLRAGQVQFAQETKDSFNSGAEDAIVALDRLVRSVRSRVGGRGVSFYRAGFETGEAEFGEPDSESFGQVLQIISNELSERGLGTSDVLRAGERLARTSDISDLTEDVYESLKAAYKDDHGLIRADLVAAYKQVKAVFGESRRVKLAYLRFFQSVRGRLAYEEGIGCFSSEAVVDDVGVRALAVIPSPSSVGGRALELLGAGPYIRDLWTERFVAIRAALKYEREQMLRREVVGRRREEEVRVRRAHLWSRVRVGMPLTAVFLGALWLGARAHPDLAEVARGEIGDVVTRIGQVLDVGPVRAALARGEAEKTITVGVSGIVFVPSAATPVAVPDAGVEVVNRRADESLVSESLAEKNSLNDGQGVESGVHEGNPIISRADVFRMIRNAKALEIEVDGLEGGLVPSHGNDLADDEGVFRAQIQLVEPEDMEEDGEPGIGEDGEPLKAIPDFQNDGDSENNGVLAGWESVWGNFVVPIHMFQDKGVWVDLGDLPIGTNIKLFIDSEFVVFKLASVHSVSPDADFSEVEREAKDGGALIVVGYHDAFPRTVYTFEYVGGDEIFRK